MRVKDLPNVPTWWPEQDSNEPPYDSIQYQRLAMKENGVPCSSSSAFNSRDQKEYKGIRVYRVRRWMSILRLKKPWYTKLQM